MDDLQRVRSQLHRLPIFPLPGAVLLPYALIPLHVFEPRYRKLVRDCEGGAGVMALANIPADALRERITFVPGLLKTTLRYTNRPTGIQQVITFTGHR